MDEEYLLNYWININNNIIATLKRYTPDKIMMVRYENLVDSPVQETSKIFKFMQVENTEGITEYKKPKEFEWGWGPARGGDGGDVIKQLKVIHRKNKYTNTKLINLIKNNEEAQFIMKYFEYKSAEYKY
jgi:hypothetical protein